MGAGPGGFFNIKGKTVLATVEVTDICYTQGKAQEIGTNCQVTAIHSKAESIFTFLDIQHFLVVETAYGGEPNLLGHGVPRRNVYTALGI